MSQNTCLAFDIRAASLPMPGIQQDLVGHGTNPTEDGRRGRPRSGKRQWLAEGSNERETPDDGATVEYQ